MKIENLVSNNLNGISCEISNDISLGISGRSGSGKSTFCNTLSNESLKRIVTLLPKGEYRFLFSEKLVSNYSAQKIEDMPMIIYLGKSSISSSPRSTIGTHTGLFKEIREKFARDNNLTSEIFSFNNSIMWCNSCKGRGTISGQVCKCCNGGRYSQKIYDYSININGESVYIDRVNSWNIYQILEVCNELELSQEQKNVLKNMISMNIGYLTLDRIMGTLSGGEVVRVLLSEFIGHCKNMLIVIDEISIGLDRDTLFDIMEIINKLGENNQVWLIDHSDIVLGCTGEKIFFGPESGKNGGRLVLESPRSEPIYRECNVDTPLDFYHVYNLHKRNIHINELKIPKNRLTVVTGESGCGKSTLINECLVPFLKENFRNIKCEIIGQDRNQSITSKSTIATFLSIKKRLDKYKKEIFEKEINDIYEIVKNDVNVCEIINMIIKLGLGYLTLDRKIQTLSTGEFQCIHLISKLYEHYNQEMILILDEPSKGLSQNILNLLIDIFSNILKDKTKTIMIIEHNDYLIKCSDYIIDFGKRTEKTIEKLDVLHQTQWNKKCKEQHKAIKIQSKIDMENLGITQISEKVDEIYNDYDNKFKGGLLKKLSPKAEWIYDSYKSSIIEPLVVIDLEKNLYSKNTFLYEVAGIVNSIIEKTRTNRIKEFDFYNTENLCLLCKGNGEIETIDLKLIMKDLDKGIWEGLLKDEIMIALKKYNYSKIKFLFNEIKKETGYNLSQSYNQMNEDEKKIFLYGYWEREFYDKGKKTKRRWKGIIHLILKYTRHIKSILKNNIMESKTKIICPICEGAVLKHGIELKVMNNKDIRKIITSKVKENLEILSDIPALNRITKFLGDDVALNMDISTLSVEEQVQIKIIEIMNSKFLGYTIVLKNHIPFRNLIKDDLKIISKKNNIVLIDYAGINMTKSDMLNTYFPLKKIKDTSYVYELLGYKKVFTKINRIRKEKKCIYCNGTGILREENIYEGIDIIETPCQACLETGINAEGMEILVEDIPIKKWICGNLGTIKQDIPEYIKELPLMLKISNLNKEQIKNIIKFLEVKDVNI